MKKHYVRWMDIVRSLELESLILTKLTKHSIPVNLVGPQVSLPPRWVPASQWSIHFLCVIRGTSGGSELTTGAMFFREIRWPVRWVPAVRRETFFAKYGGPSDGSLLSGGGIIIFRIIRRHFLAAAVDPAVSLSTYSPLPMTLVC